MNAQDHNDIYLVGHVLATPKAQEDYKTGVREANDFLLELQTLMEKHQIIRLDLNIDPYVFMKTTYPT